MARMIQENVVTYKTPALAHLFHSFPHLNVSGHHVNSAFAPNSELYLEVSSSRRIKSLGHFVILIKMKNSIF